MTTVPVSVDSIHESDNAVKLARYAQIVAMPECLLWGVSNADDDPNACQKVWTHHQRVVMARYLNEAQIEIEQIVGYPLSPKYFMNEQQPYQCSRIQLDWMKLIAIGVKAITDIVLGEPVDHSTDPAVVTVLGVGTLDPNEVHIYHPGTDAEIIPSSIDVTGGTLTIEIPRCRLVLAALENTPSDGLDYADVGTCVMSFSSGTPGNFECEVDIKRVYTDTATQGIVVYPYGKACLCTPTCIEGVDTACVYIRNAEIGVVDVRRTTTECHCAREPKYARVNYLAGVTTLTTQGEDAIIRLAHSKMPSAPCGCDTINELWARDRHVPDVLTAERENCPFGMSDGAWIAFMFANAMKTCRASVL